MAIVNEKTWQFGTALDPIAHINYNAYDATFELTASKAWLHIKNALISVPSSPWIVLGSNNGVTYGIDGVDRWNTQTDLKWNSTSIRSWMLLKQPGIASNFQLLIQCHISPNNYYGRITLVISPADGFTGGNTVDRPTATDELVVKNSGTYIAGTSANARIVLHVAVSSDGECTRILVGLNGYATSFCILDKPKNPEAGWVNPFVFGWPNAISAGQHCAEYVDCYDVAVFDGWINGSNVPFYLGTLAYGANAIGQVIATRNTQLNEWEVYPIWLCSLTPGVLGTKGQLYDVWWGTVSGSIAMGDYLMQAGVITHVAFFQLVFPFGDVIPVMAV